MTHFRTHFPVPGLVLRTILRTVLPKSPTTDTPKYSSTAMEGARWHHAGPMLLPAVVALEHPSRGCGMGHPLSRHPESPGAAAARAVFQPLRRAFGGLPGCGLIRAAAFSVILTFHTAPETVVS